MKRALRLLLERVIARAGEANRRRIIEALLASMPLSERDRIEIRYQIASQPRLLRQMKRLGFSPASILDGGAYEGHWTRMAKSIFPEATVLMIDGLPAKTPYLASVARELHGVEYRIAVLGAEPAAVRTFYEMETGSSLFAENSAVPRTEHEVETTTLDECCQTPVDLLKLDVQGAELDVLRGGAQTLASAKAVLLEVSLLEVNRGAPLLAEVVAFMHQRRFRPYDIAGLVRRPLDDALWAVDMMFVPEDSRLVRETRFDHVG